MATWPTEEPISCDIGSVFYTGNISFIAQMTFLNSEDPKRRIYLCNLFVLINLI